MNLPPARRAAQSDDHARARTLAAMRVDTPLAEDRAAWLDAHLSTCEPCRAAAEGFEADRSLLRGLAAPLPPRDLWAATAARLDRERRPARGHSAPFRLGRVPMGALAGVLVVAVVVGASYLTDRGSVPAASPAASGVAAAPSGTSSTLTAAATPIAMDRQVGLVHADTNGALGVLTATVDEVCAPGSSIQCQADTNGSTSVAVSQHPKSVVKSPNGKQLAFVLATGQGGVVIVPAPSAGTSAPPSANPTASPSSNPTPSPSTPAASASESPLPSVPPSAAPSPSPTPASRPPSQTPAPSPSAPSSSPSPTPPLVLPSPSLVDAPIAIADDVTVIGQSAAYSPSGNWFAFSARPVDGSRGPDVYVWRVGDPKAHPVTTDHRSVFSTWIGDNVLGSRAEPLAAAASTQNDAVTRFSAALSAGPSAGGPSAPGVEARSVSFLLDPSTGASRIVPGDGIWRPVVDPSGRFAVYWSGTIEVDPNGVDWSPANGTLVLAHWDPSQLVAPVTPTPDSSGSPSGSPIASASPSPGAPVALLASRPVADWDARWDETGTYLGVWLADRTGASSGRLTLHTVDLASGTLDAAGALFNDQPARTGFAIGQGRLAWVMPGDSRGPVVKVYAWSGAKGGTAQTPTQPDDTLVIR